MTAELDAESTAEATGSESKDEGESLLLPLIRGILQNPKYHKLSARQLLTLNLSKSLNNQSGLAPPSPSSRMNSEHSQLNTDDCLGNDCLPIEDSGTESGEDLRLLAAGLQSNLRNMDLVEVIKESPSADSVEPAQSPAGKGKNDALCAGLLAEVTTALARLQTSLNQGDIDLDESKKTALLSLVNRLQNGLIAPEKINDSNVDNDSAVSMNGQSSMENLPESSERRGSCGGASRFAKRRNRVSRHTVGVTREELADARRIIEELELIGMQNSNPNFNKPKITATVVNSKPGVYNAILTRQFSEPITLLRPSHFVPKETTQPIEFPCKPKHKVLLKQSISLDQPVSILKAMPKQELTPKVEDLPSPFKKFSLQRNVSGSSSKFVVNNKAIANDAPTDESSSSSDDEDEMVNTKYFNNNAAAKFKAKENYLRNQQTSERSFNYSSGDETSTPGPRQPKYTSKKMKMKRANTVDLPKSFSFVNTFDLSDKDCSDVETSHNTYSNRGTFSAGLKTTITGGSGASSKLPPQFTPKTENDKKFLAFIQKQNNQVTPSYVNPTGDRNTTKTHNWNNKFGNLKHKFENDEPQMAPKSAIKAAANSAANFWKTIEKDKPSAIVSPLPPVLAQPMMKTLPIVTEKFPWKSSVSEKIMSTDEPIVMRKKQMLDKFVPKEQKPVELPRAIPEPNKLPVLKPANVNNFSHAPMSAFKPPISRKLSNSFKPIQSNEDVIKKPMPQVSNGVVRQLAENGYSQSNPPLPQPRKIISSPTRSIADSSFVKVTKPLPKNEMGPPVPWAAKPKSERVLSLAASKFEQGAPTIHLATSLQHPASATEPTVKYRNNPLYNGTFEKRSSLPPNASYATFEPSMFSVNSGSVSNLSLSKPKESPKTFVTTDFTQPTSVSTYAPPEEKSTRPSLSRQESLTNPALEPLVLTCDRTVFSPKERLQPTMELHDIATPSSSQISNDHSIGSICGDLEHELEDIGDSVECNVAVSRVMIGPVAQTAYTQSSELTSLNSESKENSMMKSLQDSLKKLSQKSPTPEKRPVDLKRLSQDSSNSSIDLKSNSPFKLSAQLSQDSSNSSIDKLPPLKIPVPALPETSYSITYASPPKIQVKSPSIGPAQAHVLYNNVSPLPQVSLQRARSSHMLVIPRPTDPAVIPQGMYGATQSQVVAKQKTVENFFGPKRTESLSVRSISKVASNTRPVSFISPSIVPNAVARKISMFSKPVSRGGSFNSLSKSKTMPSLAPVELLDESNIDDAFEELLGSTNL